MAEGYASRSVGDGFECPICYNIIHQPKQLPCMHHFCLNCLQKYCEEDIVDQPKPCPLCRAEFIIPRGGLNFLKNSEILERLDIGKQIDDINKKQYPCQLCDESEDVKFCCMDCRQLMCDRCHTSHSKCNLTKSHNVSPVEKVTQDDIMKMNSGVCTLHGMIVNQYCSACNQLLCCICQPEHTGHALEMPSEVAKQRKQWFLENIKKVEICCEESENKLKSFDEQEHGLIEMISDTKGVIENTFEHIFELLSAQKSKLLGVLASVEEKRLLEIGARRNLARLRFTDIKNFLVYSQIVLNQGSDCEVIREMDRIMGRAEKLIQSQDEHNKQILCEKSIQFIPWAVPTEQDIRHLTGGFLYKGDWIKREEEIEDIIPACLRADVRVFESTLSTLLSGLKAISAAQKTSIVEKVEGTLALLSADRETVSENSKIKGRVILDGDILKTITEASKFFGEKTRLDTTNAEYREKILIRAGPDTKSTNKTSRIIGISMVADKIYCIQSDQCKVNVLHYISLLALSDINIPNLGSPSGMAGCSSPKSLFISDAGNNCIHRVDLISNTTKPWSMIDTYKPRGISVSSGSTVLVAAVVSEPGWFSGLYNAKSKLIEYSTDGELLREIKPDDSIKEINHAVQISHDSYAICYSHQRRLCVITSQGKILHSSTNYLSNKPVALSLNAIKERIYLVDNGQHGIIVYDYKLKFIGTVSTPGDFRWPNCVHYDPALDRLLSGEYSGRILAISP